MGNSRLPDLLAPNLRIIFVGTAAGKRSAELGHYYAGRGNRFWRTLHEVGLTPRQFAPEEDSNLLALHIGLTDMSKLGAGMDHQIASHEFDPAQFVANVRRYRPRAVAFTSKKAASVWLGKGATRTIPYGRQPDRPADFPKSSSSPRPPAPHDPIGTSRHGKRWPIGSRPDDDPTEQATAWTR